MNAFTKKSSFSYNKLIQCRNNKLFGPNNTLLPTPPILMFDHITEISTNDKAHNKGLIITKLDIKPEL